MNFIKNLIFSSLLTFIYGCAKENITKMENDLKFVPNQVEVKWYKKDSIEEASKDSDAIVVLTEWEEFYSINWEFIYKIMRKPAWVFDTRSVLNSSEVIEAGINFWKLGKGLN